MWKESKNTLQHEYKFKDFQSALEFVNKVGTIAESVSHHPDIELGWGRVKITLTTHAEGKVTKKDYHLADKIDQL